MPDPIYMWDDHALVALSTVEAAPMCTKDGGKLSLKFSHVHGIASPNTEASRELQRFLRGCACSTFWENINISSLQKIRVILFGWCTAKSTWDLVDSAFCRECPYIVCG